MIAMVWEIEATSIEVESDLRGALRIFLPLGEFRIGQFSNAVLVMSALDELLRAAFGMRPPAGALRIDLLAVGTLEVRLASNCSLRLALRGSAHDLGDAAMARRVFVDATILVLGGIPRHWAQAMIERLQRFADQPCQRKRRKSANNPGGVGR